MRRQVKLVVAGIAALATGGLVYVADRPVGWFAACQGPFSAIDFGSVGGWLPDALHPFGMTLITAAVCGGSRKAIRNAAFFWCGVNLFFEAGQGFGDLFAHALHSMGDGGLPHLLAAYFANGTFDPMDILAILAGSAMAVLFGRCFPVKKPGSDADL